MPGAQVLDSHALLVLLRDEPAAEAVADILERAGERDPLAWSVNLREAGSGFRVDAFSKSACWLLRPDGSGRRVGMTVGQLKRRWRQGVVGVGAMGI